MSDTPNEIESDIADFDADKALNRALSDKALLLARNAETAADLERAEADIAELVGAINRAIDGMSGSHRASLESIRADLQAALAKHACAEGSG